VSPTLTIQCGQHPELLQMAVLKMRLTKFSLLTISLTTSSSLKNSLTKSSRLKICLTEMRTMRVAQVNYSTSMLQHLVSVMQHGMLAALYAYAAVFRCNGRALNVSINLLRCKSNQLRPSTIYLHGSAYAVNVRECV
jgi:hypothetical protein